MVILSLINQLLTQVYYYGGTYLRGPKILPLNQRARKKGKIPSQALEMPIQAGSSRG